MLTEPTKRALPCAPQLRESDAEVLELLSGELKVSIAGDRPMLTRADGRGLELRVVS